MKKTVALCMAICAIGLLATCKSNSSLTSQLKKMPKKAMLLTEVSECGITLNDMESLYPNGMTILGKCRFKYPMDRRFAQCGGVLLKP